MLIDLDERPARSAARSLPPARAVVRPVALVLVVLVLLGLSGSVPAPPPIRELFTTPGRVDTYALATTALFTSEQGNAGFESAVLRGYVLGEAAPVWTADLNQGTGDLLYAERPAVLAVRAHDGVRAVFLDGPTGRELWRTDDTAGLLRLTGTDAVLVGGSETAPEIRLADLRTGAVRWSYPVPPGGILDTGDTQLPAGDHVVLVDRAGRVTVLGLADGRVLGRADHDWAPATSPDSSADVAGGDTAGYFTAGGRFFVAPDGDVLTAYRLPGLEKLWESAARPVQRPSPCGPLVCVATRDGLVALDGATGEQRWAAGGWTFGIDARVIGLPGSLRIAVSAPRSTSARALLDPETGTELARIGDGRVAGPYVLQRDTDRPQRTWVRTPGDRSALRTLGSLEEVITERCQAVPDTLACATSDGRLALWRIPL